MGHHWFFWLLLGLWWIGVVLGISSIGEEPKPNTPTMAAMRLAIVLLMTAGLFAYWGK